MSSQIGITDAEVRQAFSRLKALLFTTSKTSETEDAKLKDAADQAFKLVEELYLAAIRRLRV